MADGTNTEEFIIEDWQHGDIENVFVFGRFVEDLKTVDYEAIAMLNVSATQEVAQQLEVAQLEIKELKDENRILQSRLDKIERMLQDRAPETPQPKVTIQPRARTWLDGLLQWWRS